MLLDSVTLYDRHRQCPYLIRSYEALIKVITIHVEWRNKREKDVRI